MSHPVGTLPDPERGAGMYRQYHADHAPAVDLDEGALPASAGGGVCVHWPDRAQVIVDPAHVGARRDETVIHELVHAWRGPAPRGHRFRYLRVREERIVRSLTAEAIVPTMRLAEFCDRMADLGEGVGPEEVMHEFDCTRRVAEDALDNLTRHERGTR